VLCVLYTNMTPNLQPHVCGSNKSKFEDPVPRTHQHDIERHGRSGIMLLSVLKVLEVLSPLDAQRAGILTEVPVDFLGSSRQMAG